MIPITVSIRAVLSEAMMTLPMTYARGAGGPLAGHTHKDSPKEQAEKLLPALELALSGAWLASWLQ